MCGPPVGWSRSTSSLFSSSLIELVSCLVDGGDAVHDDDLALDTDQIAGRDAQLLALLGVVEDESAERAVRTGVGSTIEVRVDPVGATVPLDDRRLRLSVGVVLSGLGPDDLTIGEPDAELLLPVDSFLFGGVGADDGAHDSSSSVLSYRTSPASPVSLPYWMTASRTT